MASIFCSMWCDSSKKAIENWNLNSWDVLRVLAVLGLHEHIWLAQFFPYLPETAVCARTKDYVNSSSRGTPNATPVIQRHQDMTEWLMLSQGTCPWWQDSTLLYDLSTLGLFDAFLCACVCFIHNQWKSVRWNLSEKSEKQDCKFWGGGTPSQQAFIECHRSSTTVPNPRGCTIAGSQSHHFLPPEHREQQQPSTNSTEIVHEPNVIFSTTAATTSTTSNTTQQQQRTTKDKLHMLMTISE